MQERWVRFEHQGDVGFGQVNGDRIAVYAGNLFREPVRTERQLPLAEVRLLSPCLPGKLIGLWNNFQARAAKEGLSKPEHPLYFIKADNCYAGHLDPIVQPRGYDGPVVFEGELGVVIGRRCSHITPAEADAYIFGYTCVNDLTARDILKRDPSFVQWSRAKSFDGFGPMGPWIATGVEPDALTVRTLVNGEVRQEYPVADMFYRPREIVALLSRDMTLNPGDVIACGTSLGAGPLNRGDTVEIAIEGVGTLTNRFA